MGYATAPSATGGIAHSAFAKSAHNPILRETDAVLSPGGGSVTVGPDGGSCIVYHGRACDYTQPRTLQIDPLFWSGSSIVTPGPSTGPQTVPSEDTIPVAAAMFGFRVGGHEIGHLHGDHAAHFDFRRCRCRASANRVCVGPHPVNPHSTRRCAAAGRSRTRRRDVNDVIELMRLNPAALVAFADVTRPAFELGVGRNLKVRRTIRVIVRATARGPLVHSLVQDFDPGREEGLRAEGHQGELHHPRRSEDAHAQDPAAGSAGGEARRCAATSGSGRGSPSGPATRPAIPPSTRTVRLTR